MQLSYNSPGGYSVHVLFSQFVYFPISGPGRPSGKPRYEFPHWVMVAQCLALWRNSYAYLKMVVSCRVANLAFL